MMRTTFRTPALSRWTAAAVTASAALILSGCAASVSPPESVALSEEQGWPEDAPVPGPGDDRFDLGPAGWLADDRATFTIVTFGSSSCPYIATSVEVLDRGLLAISFAQEPAEACTDDLAARTHVFATPEGVGRDALEAELTLTANAFGDVEAEVVRVQLWPVPGAEGGDPPVESIAVETVRGTPTSIQLPDDALETGDPLAYWAEGRSQLLVVTWGSSGCPPVPRSIEVVDPTLLRLDFAAHPADFCTADFAPTTHIFATPEGVDAEAAVSLALTLEERAGPPAQYDVPVRD